MPSTRQSAEAARLEAYGYKPDERLAKFFNQVRRTHNGGVFDAYTADMRKARSSGVVIGPPNAYGRSRIIGDYRPVALYGVDFLVADKQRERTDLDGRHSTEDVIRLREELAEQIRSLNELKQISQARRAIADISPRPNLVLEFGDRVGVLAHRGDFAALRRFFGDSIKGTAEFSYISIRLGMALGFLIGAIQVPLPAIGKLSIGLARVLIAALVLSMLLISLFVYRMRYDEVAGIFAGACGKPAILAYANELAPTERPDIGYAMIFPGMTIGKTQFSSTSYRRCCADSHSRVAA